MATYTITVYVDTDENPRKWSVAECFGGDVVVGWDITDGHGEDCAGCNAEAGEPCRPGCLSSVTDDEGQPLADDPADRYGCTCGQDARSLARRGEYAFAGEHDDGCPVWEEAKREQLADEGSVA